MIETDTVPPPTQVAPPRAVETGRVVSIDALRGFDMFWISGGEELVHSLAAATAWVWATGFAHELSHSKWAGFTCYDLIQPLFLFITGITLPLTIGRRMARGMSRAQIFRQLLVRAAWLWVLGHIDKNGPVSFHVEQIRFTGVLNRIGLAGLLAGTIMMFTRPRGQVLWIVGLLAGYWALLTFVAAPGQVAPSYDQGLNIVDWLDQHIMPGRLMSGNHDANGWSATPSVVATVLLGGLAGTWLLSAGRTGRKVGGLVAAGVALVAAGWVWNFQFPIIKHIWTSSYVLYAGGWSCLLLAAFYGVIDGLQWKKWAFPFVLIGMNPLLIYLLKSTRFIDFPYIANFFFGFAFDPHNKAVASLERDIVVILLELGLLYVMYRKKWFWRV